MACKEELIIPDVAERTSGSMGHHLRLYRPITFQEGGTLGSYIFLPLHDFFHQSFVEFLMVLAIRFSLTPMASSLGSGFVTGSWRQVASVYVVRRLREDDYEQLQYSVYVQGQHDGPRSVGHRRFSAEAYTGVPDTPLSTTSRTTSASTT